MFLERTGEPKISWPRLRRQHCGCPPASIYPDITKTQVSQKQIYKSSSGKALEYFSRHYGRVYVEEGREFTVKEALVGINQLYDQSEGEAGGTPINCEPITRQFLRIFGNVSEVKRDQIQKYLRGTGIGPSDFLARGWTAEKKKIFYWPLP